MYEPELDLAHQSLTFVGHLLHFDLFHYFLKESNKYYIIWKAIGTLMAMLAVTTNILSVNIIKQ